MRPLVDRIRDALMNEADEATREGTKRFFKEAVVSYGVRSKDLRRIEREFWPELKQLTKEQLFSVCEGLLSGYLEEAILAGGWLPRIADTFVPGDMDVFRGWIELYIDNWAKCDTFCNHSVGDLLMRFPERTTDLAEWAHSDNRWLKRAAAVSLIVPAKRGLFLAEVFRLADILLLDPDDLVQKGYGWMLKEASRLHQEEVFHYVLENRQVMPRTALRYAIELMPKEMRAEAMLKRR